MNVDNLFDIPQESTPTRINLDTPEVLNNVVEEVLVFGSEIPDIPGAAMNQVVDAPILGGEDVPDTPQDSDEQVPRTPVDGQHQQTNGTSGAPAHAAHAVATSNIPPEPANMAASPSLEPAAGLHPDILRDLCTGILGAGFQGPIAPPNDIMHQAQAVEQSGTSMAINETTILDHHRRINELKLELGEETKLIRELKQQIIDTDKRNQEVQHQIRTSEREVQAANEMGVSWLFLDVLPQYLNLQDQQTQWKNVADKTSGLPAEVEVTEHKLFDAIVSHIQSLPDSDDADETLNQTRATNDEPNENQESESDEPSNQPTVFSTTLEQLLNSADRENWDMTFMDVDNDVDDWHSNEADGSSPTAADVASSDLDAAENVELLSRLDMDAIRRLASRIMEQPSTTPNNVTPEDDLYIPADLDHAYTISTNSGNADTLYNSSETTDASSADNVDDAETIAHVTPMDTAVIDNYAAIMDNQVDVMDNHATVMDDYATPAMENDDNFETEYAGRISFSGSSGGEIFQSLDSMDNESGSATSFIADDVNTDGRVMINLEAAASGPIYNDQGVEVFVPLYTTSSFIQMLDGQERMFQAIDDDEALLVDDVATHHDAANGADEEFVAHYSNNELLRVLHAEERLREIVNDVAMDDVNIVNDNPEVFPFLGNSYGEVNEAEDDFHGNIQTGDDDVQYPLHDVTNSQPIEVEQMGDASISANQAAVAATDFIDFLVNNVTEFPNDDALLINTNSNSSIETNSAGETESQQRTVDIEIESETSSSDLEPIANNDNTHISTACGIAKQPISTQSSGSTSLSDTDFVECINYSSSDLSDTSTLLAHDCSASGDDTSVQSKVLIVLGGPMSDPEVAIMGDGLGVMGLNEEEEELELNCSDFCCCC